MMSFQLIGDFKTAILFPSFSLIGPTLRKTRMEQAEAFLVVPKWPTQP